MASDSIAGCGVWQAPNGEAIEYDIAVMEEIRVRAVTGFHSFGHGGLETGGVLYGIGGQGESARVLDFAELECEHANGPGFVLSPKDHDNLAALLNPPRGLDAVGWYTSHTRGGMELTASDREIFDVFFPQPGAFALVLQPTKLGPARAAFYIRAATGAIEEPQQDFLLTPLPKQRIEPDEPEAPPAPESFGAETSPPMPPPLPPPVRHRRSWKSRYAGWLWAALGAAAFAAIWMTASSEPSSGELELRTREVSPGQVHIEWNRGSEAIQKASAGVLEIRDGAEVVRLPMNGDELRTSSATYAVQSGDISVSLQVESENGGGAEQATVQFSGKPAQKDSPALAQNAPPVEPRLETAFAERSGPPDESSRDAKPEPRDTETAGRIELNRREPAPLQQPEPEKASGKQPEPGARPVREFVIARAKPFPAGQSSIPIPVPPAPGPLSGPRQLPLVLPGSSNITVPAPPSPQVAAYAGPRTGRLVWTGSLGRRGVVEIEDGFRPSVGSLLGALPGVPVSVRVSPAEFREDGLVVYVSDASRNKIQEAPSVSNGWNPTTFEWEPLNAGQIVVLEPPSGSNGYRRLVLRSDARSCSVIVIEWTAR